MPRRVYRLNPVLLSVEALVPTCFQGIDGTKWSRWFGRPYAFVCQDLSVSYEGPASGSQPEVVDAAFLTLAACRMFRGIVGR